MPRAEEKVVASCPTRFTSSYRVTTQNPGPFGSSCQWIGSLSRSHENASCGWPPSKAPGSKRSSEGAVVMVRGYCN